MYWEAVGGKHGRYGKYHPWYAQLVSHWEDDPERPMQRRRVLARREGPFATKREADAFIATQGEHRP